MSYYVEFMERSTETTGKCSVKEKESAKMTKAEMAQIALSIVVSDLSIDDKHLLDCLEKLKVSKDRAVVFVRVVLSSRVKLNNLKTSGL